MTRKTSSIYFQLIVWVIMVDKMKIVSSASLKEKLLIPKKFTSLKSTYSPQRTIDFTESEDVYATKLRRTLYEIHRTQEHERREHERSHFINRFQQGALLDVKTSVLDSWTDDLAHHEEVSKLRRGKRSVRRRTSISNKSASKKSSRQRSKLNTTTRHFSYPIANAQYSTTLNSGDTITVSPLLRFSKVLKNGGLINFDTTPLLHAHPSRKLTKAYLEVFFRSPNRRHLMNAVMRLVQQKNGRNYIAARGQLNETSRLMKRNHGQNRFGVTRPKGVIGNFQFLITDLLKSDDNLENFSESPGRLRRLTTLRLPNLKLSVVCRNQRRRIVSCVKQGVSMYKNPRIVLRTQRQTNNFVTFS